MVSGCQKLERKSTEIQRSTREKLSMVAHITSVRANKKWCVTTYIINFDRSFSESMRHIFRTNILFHSLNKRFRCLILWDIGQLALRQGMMVTARTLSKWKQSFERREHFGKSKNKKWNVTIMCLLLEKKTLKLIFCIVKLTTSPD